MAKKRSSQAEEIPRKRGRPRLDERSSDSGRVPVGDKLLRALIRDPKFLTQPRSEGQTARLLTVNKSALREAVIGFVRVGWLKRTEEGISRDELTPARLAELFAMRLFIEVNSTRRVITKEADQRHEICLRLARVINEQAGLAESDREEDRVNWFMCSVRFHVMITQEAGSPDNARFLETVLWLLRIGSCAPLEDLQLRKKVTDDHRQIIEGIRNKDWSEEVFIKDHIRGPMERGLLRLLSLHVENGEESPSRKDKPKLPTEITNSWQFVLNRLVQVRLAEIEE